MHSSYGLNQPLYLVALASDASIVGVSSGIFEQPLDDSDLVQRYRDLNEQARQAYLQLKRDCERQNQEAAQAYLQLKTDCENQLREASEAYAALFTSAQAQLEAAARARLELQEELQALDKKKDG